jgi:hypothetical protein
MLIKRKVVDTIYISAVYLVSSRSLPFRISMKIVYVKKHVHKTIRTPRDSLALRQSLPTLYF